MNAVWRTVEAELDRAQAEQRTVRFWLRDDDAVAVTRPLERLRDLCVSAGMPVLLAVIPAAAEADLGPWIVINPSFVPCQHGYSHTNHAAPGSRACELGGDRPLLSVIEDLERGRRRLQFLFDGAIADILVPPWNRIDPALIPHLPGLGFAGLSTFGLIEAGGGILRLNADLDIIDWRNGRVGRSFEDVYGRLARLMATPQAADRPIGILTHHLAHDDKAWAVLDDMLERLRAHPAADFVDAISAMPQEPMRGRPQISPTEPAASERSKS